MKKTTNSLTRTQTASWQFDSMTKADGMDNDSNHPSYKALTKYSGNPSSAPAGNPDSINAGRGSLKGNTNPTGVGPKQAPTSAMPAQVKIKNPDYINGGAQVRTPGGTREMPARGKESFDYGRGPTKGNQQ